MKKITKLFLFAVLFMGSSIAIAQTETPNDSTYVEMDEIVLVGSGVIDLAADRKTPVAVSTIKASTIQQRAVGNVEFSEAFKNTPSIYVSNQAGGFGDSQVFTRGFSQSNTAFLLRHGELLQLAQKYLLHVIAYRDGLGRGADARLSREWFGKAAEQGHGPAAVVLAEDALQSGQSEAATKWIEAAMSAGESRGFALKAESLRANDPGSAAVFLGVALGLGDAQAGLALADLALASSPPDPGAARSALAQAAALGSARALARLGIAYRDGFGTAPDPVVAFVLLQEALSLGDPEGARALGEMMSAEDAGYWRNPSLGLAYCLWAIKSLDGANCDEIRAGLSAQEIAEGEALAKDF